MHARLLRPAGRSLGPLVMLHGLGVSAASLGPLAERLAERHATLVWDLPGFGLSRARGVWSTARVAEAVDAGLARRGIQRATVIGHSWGCHVACLLAVRNPGLVERLVMLSPAFDRRFGGIVGQFLRLTLDAPMERVSLVVGGAQDYLRAGPVRVLATLREASRIPLDELVGQVDAPVMIVRGSRDPLTTRRWAAELASRTRHPATLAVVPGAHHALGHDAPRAAAAAIEAFIGRGRTQGG